MSAFGGGFLLNQGGYNNNNDNNLNDSSIQNSANKNVSPNKVSVYLSLCLLHRVIRI